MTAADDAYERFVSEVPESVRRGLRKLSRRREGGRDLGSNQDVVEARAWLALQVPKAAAVLAESFGHEEGDCDFDYLYDTKLRNQLRSRANQRFRRRGHLRGAS